MGARNHRERQEVNYFPSSFGSRVRGALVPGRGLLSVGGILGVNARYWLGVFVNRWTGAQFPWATFTINVSGSFAIGLLSVLLVRWLPHPHARLFVVRLTHAARKLNNGNRTCTVDQRVLPAEKASLFKRTTKEPHPVPLPWHGSMAGRPPPLAGLA